MVAVCAAATLLAAAPAGAAAIITNGAGIFLGVDTFGQLNVPDGTSGVTLKPANSSSVGLYYAVVNGDATSPGCLCEGFGVAANGVAGDADNDTGTHNLTSDSFTATASTAVATAHLTAGATLQVTHDYHPSSSPALYAVDVSLTNTGATPLNNVLYNRTMDWDIPPTTFHELVTIQGWGATALTSSCDDGFLPPNPLTPCDSLGAPLDANFFHSGPSDHGARFTFNFGGLNAGETKTFTIFYGAAPSQFDALNALSSVGAEVFSLGQCNPAGDATCGARGAGSPATFMFGFAGVGGTAVPPPHSVPEPGSLALLGASGIAALFRRRNRLVR